MPFTPDFDRLLRPGARFTDEHGSYLIERHPVADVVLPTGHVVGCDPLVNPESEPYTVAVPPGAYPLHVWVAVVLRDDTETDRRVAALQLVIDDQPVESWEMALVDRQDPGTLGADGYFGYGVDAGMGTLADVTATQALASWPEERIEEVLVPDGPVAGPVPDLVVAVVDEASGANVVTVPSGWGDGSYGTWIGRTGDGRVAAFVTDFMVVPTENEFLVPEE